MKKCITYLIITITFNLSLIAAYDDYIDFKNSQLLHQRHASEATCGEHLPLISTYSVNGCIFIVLYDAKNKTGVAAHWDDDTKRSDIELLFKLLEQKGSNFSDIEAHLIGGWDSSIYFWSKKTARFLENALLTKNITNINKNHLFEKKAYKGSISYNNLADHYFMGIEFNACTGTLKFSDTQLPRNMKDTAACLNELDESLPLSGCSLKFIKLKKIKPLKNEI